MSARHQENLATARDTGDIYAYAYGVTRELVRQLTEDLMPLDRAHVHLQELVAAVEFRVAALAAEVLAEDLAQERAIRRHVFVPPVAPVTPIYVSDENDDERTNVD